MSNTHRISLAKWSKQSIFINPNSYGEEGYSLIPWLLLFFDRVVVYAPASLLITATFDKRPKDSFTTDEFRSAILRGEIVPVGFDTFRDLSQRAKKYPSSMQVASEFDRDIVDRATGLGRKFQSLNPEFQVKTSSGAAVETVSRSIEIVEDINGLREQLRSGTSSALPARYRNYLAGQLPFPEPLKRIKPQKDHQLAAMIVYDLLNEKYAMAECGASVHYAFGLENALDAVHGVIDLGIHRSSASNPRMANSQRLSAPSFSQVRQEVLRELVISLEEFKAARSDRLSLEFVRKFRKDFGPAFVGDLADIMYSGKRAREAYDRQQDIRHNVQKFCKKYTLRFGLSPMVMFKLLKFIDYAALSDGVDSVFEHAFQMFGGDWEKFNDVLKWSFDKKGRWAYWLFGRRSKSSRSNNGKSEAIES